MKINMIVPGAGHSGGIQMAFKYLNYFTEQGHSVVCYVPLFGSYHGWKRILFLKTLLRTISSEDMRGKWFDNKFKLKFVFTINNLSVRNADVVIATSWITSYWVMKLNRNKGKKVYFIQGFETWGNEKQNKLVRKSYHLPYDLRISVSTQLHDKLLAEEKCDSIIVCNGIEMQNIYKGEIVHTSNKCVIGMPYRESRGKGTDVKNCNIGISVLKQLNNNSEITCTSYGFAKPLEWDGGIEFLENPSRDELFKWYDRVDVFYVPSIYEGWGLPAIEAMSRGCVVVAGRTGCIAEFGIDNVNCKILNDVTNATESASEIYALISNMDVLDKLANGGLKSVKSYTFEKSANLFLEKLEKLII